MTENDSAWQRYFDATDVLDQIQTNGHALVSAAELKALSGREPRLLAKIDTLAERPSVFKSNDLALFPTRNGQYILFNDPEQKTYFPLASACYSSDVQWHEPLEDLSAYDSFPGIQKLNESQALDFAYISSLLRRFTQDPKIQLAIRGRMFSRAFSFQLPVNKAEVRVQGVQIEVDGGYESADAIYLFEAKQGRRADFNIRQLYYPYLEWRSRSRKRIVPIFFVITNGIFHFVEFQFSDTFGDLKIARAESYTLQETKLPGISLSALMRQTPLESPSSIPFPQADDLDKVIDLLSMLEGGPATKVQVAEHFEFDERQGDYYGNAATYLGLVHRSINGFALTPTGVSLINLPERNRRTRELITAMLSQPSFRDVFIEWAALGLGEEFPSKAVVAEIIARHSTLGMSTPSRRAGTVLAWLRWVATNADLSQ